MCGWLLSPTGVSCVADLWVLPKYPVWFIASLPVYHVWLIVSLPEYHVWLILSAARKSCGWLWSIRHNEWQIVSTACVSCVASCEPPWVLCQADCEQCLGVICGWLFALPEYFIRQIVRSAKYLCGWFQVLSQYYVWLTVRAACMSFMADCEHCLILCVTIVTAAYLVWLVVSLVEYHVWLTVRAACMSCMVTVNTAWYNVWQIVTAAYLVWLVVSLVEYHVWQMWAVPWNHVWLIVSTVWICCMADCEHCLSIMCGWLWAFLNILSVWLCTSLSIMCSRLWVLPEYHVAYSEHYISIMCTVADCESSWASCVVDHACCLSRVADKEHCLGITCGWFWVLPSIICSWLWELPEHHMWLIVSAASVLFLGDFNHCLSIMYGWLWALTEYHVWLMWAFLCVWHVWLIVSLLSIWVLCMADCERWPSYLWLIVSLPEFYVLHILTRVLGIMCGWLWSLPSIM